MAIITGKTPQGNCGAVRCLRPGASKWTATEKWANFKQYALQNFGCAATVELSRFAFYHRQSRQEVPITAASYQGLARQLARAIRCWAEEAP